MKPRLALFTANYPFLATGGEVMFITPEVRHLTQAFEVTVIPLIKDGPNVDPDAGVVVEGGLAEAWLACGGRVQKLCAALSSPRFYVEALACLREWRPISVKQLALFAAQYQVTRDWLRTADVSKRFDLLYTYWCSPTTAALVETIGVPTVSRLHGGDLYRERQWNRHLPGQQTTLPRLARAFCISDHGRRYLEALGLRGDNVALARLGVAAQQAARRSTDGVLRVVSCSFVVPLKRVEAIYDALASVARARPQQRIDWVHLGGGPQLKALEGRASQKPENLTIKLPGTMRHEAVIEFYQSHPVDLFLHASVTEGLPVCIQEAMSFGVPVISTDVGGIYELVGGTGALVPADQPVEGLARSVLNFLEISEGDIEGVRRRAQGRQRTDFDSAKNHRVFTEALLQCAGHSRSRAT